MPYLRRKKLPQQRKPKQLGWREKSQVIGVLLMFTAAGVFGAATAFSKRSFVYHGRIAKVDEPEATIEFVESRGHAPYRLRYNASTEFMEAGRHVVPSQKLNGMRAKVIYKNSLFVSEYALKIELGK